MRLERLPRVLHLEGAAVAVAALSLYLHGSHSLLLLAVLVLAPDLGALGFLAGPRVGALTYNALHTLGGPVLLGAIGVILPAGTATAVALIWLLHIGIDRALGYGLKYPSAFKDTHPAVGLGTRQAATQISIARSASGTPPDGVTSQVSCM